jgi:translation initiation factor IF-3
MTSAADLKFLQQSRRGSFRNFKSKSGTRIINLLVPLCFRSSCQRVPQCITNFGSGALGQDGNHCGTAATMHLSLQSGVDLARVCPDLLTLRGSEGDGPSWRVTGGWRPLLPCQRIVATAEEIFAIRRPMKPAQQPVTRDGPRINEEIRVREVQLIDKDGANKGVVDIETALNLAVEAGLDLVEIAPNSTPPVAKILDFGKYKYQAQKKAAEARKKQKVVEIKEIKIRPMIDDHDYDVKMRSMRRFFEEGDKVKVTLRFRGREMAHQELGVKLLERVKGDTATLAKVEQEPKFEGRQMIMVLAPR